MPSNKFNCLIYGVKGSSLSVLFSQNKPLDINNLPSKLLYKQRN